MNTDEILGILTGTQRKELDEKLHIMAAGLAHKFHQNPENFAHVTQVLELKENIKLQVTVSLHLGDKGIIHPVIEEITQTAPVNQSK